MGNYQETRSSFSQTNTKLDPMRRQGHRQRQDVGAGPGGEDYFQIGWWLESGERVNQDLREQSWSSENEALLHKNRNIFMLSAIFNFKPVCNYAEPDVPRLNSGWNLIVTDPAWARGPLCHGCRWSERSVVTIWKCYPDQSCLASSRSGSLFREKERAVTAHLKLPLSRLLKSFYHWCSILLKLFCKKLWKMF